jgi:hypothetical protein
MCTGPIPGRNRTSRVQALWPRVFHGRDHWRHDLRALCGRDARRRSAGVAIDARKHELCIMSSGHIHGIERTNGVHIMRGEHFLNHPPGDQRRSVQNVRSRRAVFRSGLRVLRCLRSGVGVHRRCSCVRAVPRGAAAGGGCLRCLWEGHVFLTRRECVYAMHAGEVCGHSRKHIRSRLSFVRQREVERDARGPRREHPVRVMHPR